MDAEIADLRSSDALVRSRSIARLLAMGPAAADRLIPLLADEDPRLRHNITYRLLRPMGDEVVPRLRECAAAADPPLSDLACIALARMASPAAFSALFEMAIESQPPLASTAINCVLLVDNAVGAERHAELMTRSHAHVRRIVTASLVRLESNLALHYLLQESDDDDGWESWALDQLVWMSRSEPLLNRLVCSIDLPFEARYSLLCRLFASPERVFGHRTHEVGLHGLNRIRFICERLLGSYRMSLDETLAQLAACAEEPLRSEAARLVAWRSLARPSESGPHPEELLRAVGSSGAQMPVASLPRPAEPVAPAAPRRSFWRGLISRCR